MVENNAISDHAGSFPADNWQGGTDGIFSTLPITVTPQAVTLAASAESFTAPLLKSLH